MNVFDIIGPVMIGPSSSHTAGAARIGRMAGALLGAPAVKAEIRPVSYTHLDVYKRQIVTFSFASASGLEP